MRDLLRLILGIVSFSVFLATPALGQTGNNSPDAVWRSFRTVYPYHIQCIGLTEPDSDGTRVLLIAEPPPQVTLESLRALSPSLLQHPLVNRQTVGYDGWVADVLYLLPQMSGGDLRELLDSLNHHLFGTSYKSTIMALPPGNEARGKRNLDLKIPAGEVGEWVLGDLAYADPGRSTLNLLGLILFGLFSLVFLRRVLRASRTRRQVFVFVFFCGAFLTAWFAGKGWHHNRMLHFTSVLGGAPESGQQILESRTSGVFLSDTPGVVLWSFPRKSPLNANLIHAREFVLDSDVVIGAVASADQVLILGRERCLPLAVLPPLRTETIFQLASVKSDELAQSYERKDLVAGKFDGKNDWAPIYLSQNLIDTEYGSLLNITDQLLKSWSMHGMVHYVNFKYPYPQTFPFPTDLMSYAKTNEVTFNWNTKGVGYSTKNNLYEVYALNRTGALPVDYLAGDNSEMQKAEEDGYKYFAGLNDPNLVRVVQYAAVYQIFRRFGVTAPPSSAMPTTPGEKKAPESLKFPIARMIFGVGTLTDDELDRLKERARTAGANSESLVKSIDDLGLMRDGIQELRENGEPGALEQLVDALATPRDTMLRFSAIPEARQTDTDKTIAGMVILAQRNKELLQLISHMDLAQAKDAYVAEMRRTRRTWIRTPNIVLSWPENAGTIMLEGGHNLGAKITQFEFDPSLSAGELRVEEENGHTIIKHSAADADKVPELVRAAARNEGKSPSELAELLKKKLPDVQVPERPLETALGFTDSLRPAAGRGFQPEATRADLGSMGWKPTSGVIPARPKALMHALDSGKGPSVVVSRQADGSYLVAHGTSQKVIQSTDLPSAVDAAISCIKDENQNGTEMHLYLAGFEPVQGKGFANTVEVNLGENEFSRIAATIESEPIEPGELARILSKDYKLEEARVAGIEASEEGHVNVRLEVPAKEATRPTLFVRLRLFLREGFAITREFLSSVRTITESWRASLRSAPEKVDLFLAHKMLIRDLKSVHPEIVDVDMIYSREKKDIFHGAWYRDPQSGSRNSGWPV